MLSSMKGKRRLCKHGIMGCSWIPGFALHCSVNSSLTAYACVTKAGWKSPDYANNLV